MHFPFKEGKLSFQGRKTFLSRKENVPLRKEKNSSQEGKLFLSRKEKIPLRKEKIPCREGKLLQRQNHCLLLLGAQRGYDVFRLCADAELSAPNAYSRRNIVARISALVATP